MEVLLEPSSLDKVLLMKIPAIMIAGRGVDGRKREESFGIIILKKMKPQQIKRKALKGSKSLVYINISGRN